MNTIKKIVVFDLDETLGYFTELGIFCDCLNRYYNNEEFSNNYFEEILDLYRLLISAFSLASFGYQNLPPKLPMVDCAELNE